MRTLVIATAIGLLMALPAAAGDNGCTPDCCGQAVVSDAGCCDPGCCDCQRCGGKCQGGCGEVECASCQGKSCCDPCRGLPTCVTPPKCGRQRTVKRLVRKEIECQVPVYKCVPCCADPGCCEQAAPEPAEAEAQTTLSAPMPPVIGTSYVK